MVGEDTRFHLKSLHIKLVWQSVTLAAGVTLCFLCSDFTLEDIFLLPTKDAKNPVVYAVFTTSRSVRWPSRNHRTYLLAH